MVFQYKLTLNLTKTKFPIFTPRQKESHNLHSTVANVRQFREVFCVKYLVVCINCHVTWHDHIDYLLYGGECFTGN